MDLSICIVSWNTRKLLRYCLESIYAKTKGINFEIIIVDNASKDGSIEMVSNEFPKCIIIAQQENLGFSKANNIAVKIARGRYVAFLNPDTVMKTNAFVAMVGFMDVNPTYGATGCKLLNEDDTIQFTCARSFPTPFKRFCFLTLLNRIFPASICFSTSEMEYWDHKNSRDIDCLSGACMVLRKDVVERLGAFDETYFMYGEDIELCYRIRKNGWSIYYNANEEIYHLSGASSSQKSYKAFSLIMQHQANYKFFKENYGDVKAIEFKTLVFIGTIIRLFIISILLSKIIDIGKSRNKLTTNTLRKYFELLKWSIYQEKVIRKALT